MECTEVLLAVGDVLVVKALETMGKRLVRTDRSRFRIIDGQPFHLAHTIWQVDDTEVTKSLRGAWDVVPLLISRHCRECSPSADRVVRILDEYVHDLVITGTPHRLEELRYRFASRLYTEPEDA